MMIMTIMMIQTMIPSGVVTVEPGILSLEGLGHSEQFHCGLEGGGHPEHIPVFRALLETTVWHQETDSIHAKMRTASTLKNRMGRGHTNRQTDRQTLRLLDRIGSVGRFGENPAYGRHQISRPMQIVAQMFLFPLALADSIFLPAASRVFGLLSGLGCGLGFAFRKSLGGPSIYSLGSTLSTRGKLPRGSIHHATSSAFPQIGPFLLSTVPV